MRAELQKLLHMPKINTV